MFFFHGVNHQRQIMGKHCNKHPQTRRHNDNSNTWKTNDDFQSNIKIVKIMIPTKT